MIGSLDLSDVELDDEDDLRPLTLDGATTSDGGGIKSSSSEQFETTVAPEQSGASSKRSPHSMVAGRRSGETSPMSYESSSEIRLLVELAA